MSETTFYDLEIGEVFKFVETPSQAKNWEYKKTSYSSALYWANCPYRGSEGEFKKDPSHILVERVEKTEGDSE